MTKLPMLDRKQRGALLIENLRDNVDLKSRLPRVAIDPLAAEKEGTRLYHAVLAAIAVQHKRKGQLAKLRQSLRDRHAAAWAIFVDQRVIAALKIADDGLRSTLQLDEPQANGRRPELEQMSAFYRDALDSADALVQLARYGTTRADLEQGLTDVEAMETLVSQIQMTNAKKLEATRIQNETLAALDDWRHTLYKYIDIVTADAPEIRKAAGIG